MESPPILDEIRVINPYDNKSFLDESHSYCIWPNDSTRAAVFPAEEDQGMTFEPFQVEQREFLLDYRISQVLLDFSHSAKNIVHY